MQLLLHRTIIQSWNQEVSKLTLSIQYGTTKCSQDIFDYDSYSEKIRSECG